jgi:endonuclease YncB( thermonuclease family)
MIKVWRLPWLITSWVDGDTCHGTMDKGWGDMWTPPKGLRLLLADGSKYDAPERKGASLKRGNAARDWVQVLVPAGSWVMVTSHYVDPDDFGRPLCSIELEDGQDLAAAMIKRGHVK